MGACLFLLLTFELLASPSPRPRPKCDRSTRGMMWPEPANWDNAEAKRLARCGQLSMCEGATGRLKWRDVGVAYWRLANKPAPQSCSLPEEPTPAGQP